MSRLVRAAFAIAFLVMSTIGMSCDVNDYCISNCGVDGDGGNGDGGDGDGNDGGDNGDADGGGNCVPTGVEVCDNKDNDCDNSTDEGQLPTIGDLCDNQVNECAGGVKICTAGQVKCTKPPMGEICDGKDNDCDGTIDDGDPGGGAKCGTDMGECKAGVLKCTSGAIECDGEIGGEMPPFGMPESCDGKDNNCDGMIDNGAPVSPTFCDTNDDDGLCNKGVPTCIGGGTVCVGLVGPSPELCDNLDQDCDNNNTNGFFLQTDPTNCGSCGNVCVLTNAIEACVGGQCAIAACETGYHDNNNNDTDGCEFGPCTTTGNEVCNNMDDDCDGLVDAADPDLVVPPVASMCRTANECATATVVCDGTAGGFRCDYPDPDVQETNGVIQAETLCDTKDNDCDGAFDEGQPNLTQTCTKGQGECTTSGNFICDTTNLNGPAVCNAATPGVGTSEVCDGRDNDCNGTVDDNALLGNLPGQEWVTIPGPSGVEMMKYEASHPDATTALGGAITTHACSRPNVQPWTSLTYPQALAVCNGMGARLCSESEWQSTCMPDVTYPVSATALTTNVDDFVFIEAENPFANVTQSSRTWAATSPSSFNGTTGMVVTDTGFSVLNAANALSQSPRMDYQLTLSGSTAYRVWMRMRSPAVALVTPVIRASINATPTLSPTSPAATQVGDLVIVTSYSIAQGSPTHTVNAAGGFVQINSFGIDEGGGATDGRLSVAYKIATVAGATTYGAFTSSGGTSFSGITVLQAGTYDVGSIVSQTIADSTTAAPNPPSIGTVGSNVLVVGVGAWNVAASQETVDPPTGYTEQFEVATGANEIAELSAATVFGGNGDPGAFFDNVSPTNTISMTIGISGPGGSRSVWLGLNPGATAGAANSTFVATTADNQWQWVVSPVLTSGAAGTHTLSVFLREDGVIVDTIAIARQATNSPTFDNAWAYESNPRTPQPQVCNGDEFDTAPAVALAASPTGATATGFTATFTTAANAPHRLSVGSSVTIAGVGVAAYNGTWTVVTTPSATRFTATIGTSNPAASGGGSANGDQDDTLVTGSSAACHAEHGAMDAFDMSGNVKEWTTARVFGQNPLRGGSSNNAVNGLTCKLNFTLADNEFFFPNVGFRCCRD